MAAGVTPCSLHAGSVRSCIFRIPTVHVPVPSAYLQSLHSPTMIFTMSRPLPNITTVEVMVSPPPDLVHCLEERKGLRVVELCPLL